MKVGIETVVSFFPETVVRGSDYSYLLPLIPEEIRSVFKFPDESRRLRSDDAAEFLAEKVARKALDQAKLGPADIDYIIANNCGGNFCVPMVGTYIHRELGFSEETPVLNISQACASFVDACEIAWNFIIAGKYKRILVVTVSVWETKGGQSRADLTDPINASMGDGAGAAIISSQNLKCEFLSYYNRTFSETYDLCYTDLRGPAHPELKEAANQPEKSMYLYAKPEFIEWWKRVGFQFGIDGINGALKLANQNLSDLDMVIFHQPTDMLYNVWMEGAAQAGLSKDKWKHTWNKYGNLSNAVVPVNLSEFWDKGELKKDSIIALITIGAGGHAPTMIIKWLV